MLMLTICSSCYPGDTSPNKISMGVAADISYFNIYKTVSATQAAIAATYANINLVYKAQFNIFNQVNDVLIQSTTGGPAWNIQPATPGAHCSTGIQTLLNTFTSWRTQNQARKDSMWHQFTNCYPPAGIVGIHWIAALCTNNGAGISSVTSTHWLVVAHEMGHGFGGNHAFQLGQGRTGGRLRAKKLADSAVLYIVC